MGIFDSLKKSIKDLYIARPPEAAKALIWRYPEQGIPDGAKLTVRSDESVIFFREGRFAGSLDAGTYTIDTDTIPFLDNLIVAGLTGGNDYICELFFVRKAEFIHETKQRELGTYNDLASRHVITVQFNARYGVIVTDALALITMLGGQTADSSETVGRFLDSRLKSLLSAIVGQLLAEQPALSVVSNAYNEQIGQMIHEKAKDEFANQGLELTRFLGLNLSLDNESESALREFGRQQAKLTIEREGAEMAGGYANYQLAQGQRAALEGIGEGMGSGNGPNAIMGMNIGGGGGLGGGLSNRLPQRTTPSLTGGRGPTPRMPTSPKVKTAATMQWMLQSSRGVEGPYSVRQLVLRFDCCRLHDVGCHMRALQMLCGRRLGMQLHRDGLIRSTQRHRNCNDSKRDSYSVYDTHLRKQLYGEYVSSNRWESM